ncbi:MAG: hypothetical protein QXR88_01640 [Candidatus Pacearchaeota archaeon]
MAINLVHLRIFKGGDSPQKGIFAVNGVEYSLEISSGNLIVKDNRTGAEIYKASAPGIYPNGTPVEIALFSERTHPIFALYNVSAAHQLVHSTYDMPNPSDWIIVVKIYDASQVISIPSKS